MLNIDRVWSRASQLPQYRGKKLSDFVLQQTTFATQLLSLQALPSQPVNFAAGAIIIGGRAIAVLDSAVATQTTRDGLDMFKLAIADGQNNRNIVGTVQAAATAVYGKSNDQFPAKEIVVLPGGGLLYSLTNLTTSTLNVFFSHDCLVLAAVG